MRCQRTMMSICVWLSMCPMCKRPVTLGGGNNSVNMGRVSPGAGVGTENSFSLIQYSAQRASIAPGSYALGSSCGILSQHLAICTWHLANRTEIEISCRPAKCLLPSAKCLESLILQAGENGGQTNSGVVYTHGKMLPPPPHAPQTADFHVGPRRPRSRRRIARGFAHAPTTLSPVYNLKRSYAAR